MCHCQRPTAVAASLNPRYLPVPLQGTRDPLFLTGVTFPPEYPIYEETKIKLTVYEVKDKSHDTVSTGTSSFLGEKKLWFSKLSDFFFKWNGHFSKRAFILCGCLSYVDNLLGFFFQNSFGLVPKWQG